jgi:deoxycytidylate deaminase
MLLALQNKQLFHVAAILIRGKSIIRISCNSNKTHPRARRLYQQGVDYQMHAEMDALRFAKPGDILYVLRVGRDGKTLRMAKPCAHCQKHIKDHGIVKVYYTNHEGQWEKLTD